MQPPNWPYCIIAAGRSGKGVSFFRYADELAPTGCLSRTGTPRTLRHIFSQMRGLDCDLVIEEQLSCRSVADCAEELRVLQSSIKPDLNPIDRRVFQISFFKCIDPLLDLTKEFCSDPVSARAKSAEDLPKFQYIKSKLRAIGFLQLYHDSHKGIPLSAYIPRAVIENKPSNTDRVFVHSKARFPLSVLGDNSTFCVEGSYFAQQDGESWCCAHAAFMVAVQNLARALNVPDPITIAEMNEHLHIDQRFRLGRNGLADDEIIAVFEKLGVKADQWKDLYGTADSADFVIAQAYYAVECGLPAILCFQGNSAGHAMAVVGHTFDASLWSPFATRAYFKDPGRPYLPSHSWVDALIVQDDNFGPYSSLQRSVLWQKRPVAIVPRFPRSVFEGPVVAEFAASEILLRRLFAQELYFQSLLKSPVCPGEDDDGAYWLYRLMDAARSEQMVLRTTPIDPRDYLEFLDGVDEQGQTILGSENTELRRNIESRIPRNFCWLVEVSLPELYQWNHRRVGEVLVTEIPDQQDRTGLWLVRLPGVLTLPTKSGGIEHFAIKGAKHYSIVQLNFEHLRRIW